MLEYEIENEVNIVDKKNQEGFFKSFKHKIALRNQLDSQYYDKYQQINKRSLWTKFAVIYAGVFSLFHLSTNQLGISAILSIPLSLPISGVFMLLIELILSGVAKTKIGSRVSNWYYSRSKEYVNIENQYFESDNELLEMVQDPICQKEILSDLTKVILLIKPYYQETDYEYQKLVTDLDTLIGLLAHNRYEVAKDYIIDRLEKWEISLEDLEKQKIEYKKKNDFLQSINMEIVNNENINPKEYNLKTML